MNKITAWTGRPVPVFPQTLAVAVSENGGLE